MNITGVLRPMSTPSATLDSHSHPDEWSSSSTASAKLFTQSWNATQYLGSNKRHWSDESTHVLRCNWDYLSVGDTVSSCPPFCVYFSQICNIKHVLAQSSICECDFWAQESLLPHSVHCACRRLLTKVFHVCCSTDILPNLALQSKPPVVVQGGEHHYILGNVYIVVDRYWAHNFWAAAWISNGRRKGCGGIEPPGVSI